jgi:glycerol-3-phosphate dehydrogenase
VRDPAESRFAASRLSPQRRATDLHRLRTQRFDVLVIGGGVTGTGAAVDAAARGLSVALVEAQDLAAGTSSRSTKLVHGGLRYLEQAEFGLVHEALTERGRLAGELAPHLVRPVPILVPLPAGPLPVRAVRRAYYGAGVALYDGFAGLIGRRGRVMPRHRHLSRTAARRLFPSLRPEVVAGAIQFYDGQVDDARLVVTLARTAASLGAAVVSGARVVSLQRDGRPVTGAWLRERDSGEEFLVRARSVIAATGVWVDDIAAMLAGASAGASALVGGSRRAVGAGGWPGAGAGLRVRASKGVHLVVPRAAITGEVGLILRTQDSVLFALPWDGHWIIGTTDTEWRQDPARPTASAPDVHYLLGQLNQVLDRPLTVGDVDGVYAGLRPLLAGERPAAGHGLVFLPWGGRDATSALSRRHVVVEPAPGLFVVAGGKLTTYRSMAADVVDRVARRLGTAASRTPTGRLPLLGADGYAAMWRDRVAMARRHRLPLGVVEHLLRRYGSLATEVLALIDATPELAEPVTGAPEYLAAEVVYAVRAEGARQLADVLSRRTRISIETRHRGADSAPQVAALIAAELGWSTTEADRELARYLDEAAADNSPLLETSMSHPGGSG